MPVGGRGQDEQQLDRLTVDGVVVDADARDAERDGNLADAVGLAVGRGHAVADAGALDSLAAHHRLLHGGALQAAGEDTGASHHLVNRRELVRVLQVIDHGTCLEAAQH